MDERATSGRGRFGSDFGFVLAAAGSAVGLGNIWKFPYITGEYGGGAFVLVYLACIATVGLPLLYAEMIIGRRGGADVLDSLRRLTRRAGGLGTALSWATGLLAVASGYLILSFYSVVAGWALHFVAVSAGLAMHVPGAPEATFRALEGNVLVSAGWHTVFMLLCVVVVAGGVQKGIERTCKVLMPGLVALLLALLVYVAFTADLSRSLAFLFRPDFSRLSGDAVLEALGHAFFTLSLGMGAMVTYGSYLDSDRHVVRDQLAVAVLDTAIALLAGAVIFAVVFAEGAEPNSGPGLVFVSLPALFRDMPAGAVVATAFFVLVVFAAWSSGISLLEVVVALLVDRLGLRRAPATYGVGATIWALGLASAASGDVLGFLDDLTTRYMLPIGGLLIALAAGWLLAPDDREAGFTALGPAGRRWAAGWTWTIRFVTPALVILVLLHKLGIV